MKLLALVLALGVVALPQVAAAYGSMPSFPNFSYVTASQLSTSMSSVESAGLSAGAAAAASAAALSIPGVSGSVAGSASASFSGGSGSARATSVSAISAHAVSPAVVSVPVVHPTPTPVPTPTPHIHHHPVHVDAAAVVASASASASASVAAAHAHAHAVGAHAHAHTHMHGQVGLKLTKTDNRDGITHPGHTFTYTLKVENTGTEDIHDLEVQDFLPEACELMAGETAHWTNVTLDAGATKTFTIKVRVKSDTQFGEVCNTALAESRDHHLIAQDSECITIERGPAVKAAVLVQPTSAPVVVQPAAPKVAASVVPGLPVPVTAQTGAGLLGIGSGAALLGALGLYLRKLVG